MGRHLYTFKIKVALLGDFPIFNSYKNIQIINLGILDSNRVNEYLNQSKFFMENSYYQGFGLTLIEALLSGCKIISSANKGAVDAIKNLDINDKNILYYNSSNLSKIINDIVEQLRNYSNVDSDFKKPNIDFKTVFYWFAGLKYIEIFNTFLISYNSGEFNNSIIYQNILLSNELEIKSTSNKLSTASNLLIPTSNLTSNDIKSNIITKLIIRIFGYARARNIYQRYIKKHL